MRCNTFDLGTRCTAPTLPGATHCPLHEPAAGPPVATGQGYYPTADLNLEQLDQATTSSESYQCEAVSSSGKPCRAGIGSGAQFCYFHDPEHEETRRASSALGGHNAARNRRPLHPVDVDIGLSDREGIEAILSAVIRLEFLGHISPTRSRNILRAASIALRGLERRPRTSIEKQLADEWHFNLMYNIDDIAAEARANDTPKPSPVAPAAPGAENLLRAISTLSRRSAP
jgi:hypothetical protein